VRVRIKRTAAVALSLLVGFTLAQSTAASSVAADTPIDVHFTSSSPKTVEYGEFWSWDFESDHNFYWSAYVSGLATVTVSGAPAGYSPELSMYDNGTYTGILYAPYDAPPLGAGTYSIVISGSYTDGTDTYSGETAPPASLIVEKAKLGIELRVLADPANTDGAIVTARFTGRFVDEYQSSFFPSAALSPAGVWRISLTDSNGEVATERSIERAAGDDVLATSFYWSDAEPGEQYTASATFTPEGASAANFAVTPPADFSYTAAESQRPTPTSTAAAEPDAELPEATGFGLPLWSVILVGVLIVGLATLVTILVLRLRRGTSTGEGTA
jgi:hypothetical protein